MAVQTQVKFNPKLTISWLLAIFVPVIVYFVSLPLGHKMALFFALTLLAILLMAMELIDTFAVSLLLPVSYAICKVADTPTSFSGFAQATPWVFCGIYLLIGLLTRIGLMDRIAYKIMILTGGTYKGMVIGLWLTAFVLNFLLSGNGYMLTIFMMAGLCLSLGIKGKSAVGLVFLGWYAGSSSGSLFYNPTLFGLLNAMVGVDLGVDYLKFAIHQLPMLVLSILFTAVVYFLTKEENSIFSAGTAYFKEKYAQLGPMKAEEKRTIVVLLIAVVYMMTNTWHNLGIDWAYALAAVILFLPRVGTAVSEDIKSIPFSMVMFCAACLSIGTVANALGISQLIATSLAPMVSGLGTVGLTAVGMLVTAALNFVMTPLALIVLLPMPFSVVASSLGIPVLPVIYGIMNGTSMVLLPYEAVPALLMYSFGLMKMKDFIKLNAIFWVILIFWLLVVMVNWWKLVGIM